VKVFTLINYCKEKEAQTECLSMSQLVFRLLCEKKKSITQHTEHQHAKRRTGKAGASVNTSREENGKKRLQQHTKGVRTQKKVDDAQRRDEIK
jgi:hypothetical protein